MMLCVTKSFVLLVEYTMTCRSMFMCWCRKQQ